jgi:hypothetical protein
MVEPYHVEACDKIDKVCLGVTRLLLYVRCSDDKAESYASALDGAICDTCECATLLPFASRWLLGRPWIISVNLNDRSLHFAGGGAAVLNVGRYKPSSPAVGRDAPTVRFGVSRNPPETLSEGFMQNQP